MAELGFVRNESARQLRLGSSRTVAYIMLDAANPFFTDVARGIEDATASADLLLFSCSSDNFATRERSYLDRLEQQRVQGVLITPVDPASELLDALPRRGMRVVIVDRIRNAETHCSVSVDDVLGGELAAGHSLELGHERIAFVGGSDSVGQVRDRRIGALRAIGAHGGQESQLACIDTRTLTVADGRSGGERLAGLPADWRPTAAMCANDLVALGLLQQCVRLGIRVPEDLAIVGYDDFEFAGAAAVPLTSVRQPRHRLGWVAAELLLDEVANPGHQHQQVRFTPEPVVRASTRRLT
jgi:LacI family transcriptional regulator